MIRATVRLTLECDNRCIFCSQEGLEPSGIVDVEAALHSARGRRIADADLVEALAKAGVTDLQLSFHGADAASHDYHAGVEGSFERGLATLAAARAAGVKVAVVSVLTRSNFRILADIARLLAGRGVNAWLVEVTRSAA